MGWFFYIHSIQFYSYSAFIVLSQNSFKEILIHAIKSNRNYSVQDYCRVSYMVWGQYTNLVIFSISHMFGFHFAILRWLARELNKLQELLKNGRVHHLQRLRAHTNCLRKYNT